MFERIIPRGLGHVHVARYTLELNLDEFFRTPCDVRNVRNADRVIDSVREFLRSQVDAHLGSVDALILLRARLAFKRIKIQLEGTGAALEASWLDNHIMHMDLPSPAQALLQLREYVSEHGFDDSLWEFCTAVIEFEVAEENGCREALVSCILQLRRHPISGQHDMVPSDLVARIEALSV